MRLRWAKHRGLTAEASQPQGASFSKADDAAAADDDGDDDEMCDYAHMHTHIICADVCENRSSSVMCECMHAYTPV